MLEYILVPNYTLVGNSPGNRGGAKTFPERVQGFCSYGALSLIGEWAQFLHISKSVCGMKLHKWAGNIFEKTRQPIEEHTGHFVMFAFPQLARTLSELQSIL